MSRNRYDVLTPKAKVIRRIEDLASIRYSVCSALKRLGIADLELLELDLISAIDDSWERGFKSGSINNTQM